MGCIETWKSSIASVDELEINFNMGCIETIITFITYRIYPRLTLTWDVLKLVAEPSSCRSTGINFNMGCIETCYTLNPKNTGKD